MGNEIDPNVHFCRNVAEDGPVTIEFMHGEEAYEIEVTKVDQ